MVEYWWMVMNVPAAFFCCWVCYWDEHACFHQLSIIFIKTHLQTGFYVFTGCWGRWWNDQILRSKVKVPARPHYAKISTSGVLLSPISGMYGRILMHYQLHLNKHFQGHELKGQGHRQHFRKIHSMGRHTSSQFAIESSLLSTDLFAVTVTVLKFNVRVNLCFIYRPFSLTFTDLF